MALGFVITVWIFRVRGHVISLESRMRENRMSGLMSGGEETLLRVRIEAPALAKAPATATLLP